MAFSERCEYKVEILPNKVLQVRRADIILKDGKEVASSYHRHVLAPGADITNECDCVKAIAPVLWTDEVITAYNTSINDDQYVDTTDHQPDDDQSVDTTDHQPDLDTVETSDD